MPECERNDLMIDNECGSQAGPKSQIKHASAFVASQGLHAGIIHYANRNSEGARVVEVNPARSQVVRVRLRPPIKNVSRVPNGNSFKGPVRRELPDLLNEGCGTE